LPLAARRAKDLRAATCEPRAAIVSVNTIYFPDDPSPRWNQPVLALGTSMACIAGT
jgi:hypothetical protein